MKKQAPYKNKNFCFCDKCDLWYGCMVSWSDDTNFDKWLQKNCPYYLEIVIDE